MNTPETRLAEVVSVALNDAGISENAASKRTGIPRSTLGRRLTKGDFKYGELCEIAGILNTTEDELARKARQAAA